MTTRRAGTGSTLTPYHQPRTARPNTFAYLTKRERIEQHEVCYGRKRKRRHAQPRITEWQRHLAQDGGTAVNCAVWRTQKLHGAASVPGRRPEPGEHGRTNDHSGKQNGELKRDRPGAYAYLTPARQSEYDRLQVLGFGFRFTLEEIEVTYCDTHPERIELFKRLAMPYDLQAEAIATSQRVQDTVRNCKPQSFRRNGNGKH